MLPLATTQLASLFVVARGGRTMFVVCPAERKQTCQLREQEKRFRSAARPATPPREAQLIRRRPRDWVAGAARF